MKRSANFMDWHPAFACQKRMMCTCLQFALLLTACSIPESYCFHQFSYRKILMPLFVHNSRRDFVLKSPPVAIGTLWLTNAPSPANAMINFPDLSKTMTAQGPVNRRVGGLASKIRNIGSVMVSFGLFQIRISFYAQTPLYAFAGRTPARFNARALGSY
jgi:hypothetical protein